METRLRTHMDALGVRARLNDLNQVILVERNIDEFLQTNADQLAHALERLSNAYPRGGAGKSFTRGLEHS